MTKESDLEAEIIGDENVEILKLEKSVSLSVGKKRVKLIKKALSIKDYKYIFLDDGFQHLKIKRNLNIILFNSLTPSHLMKVVPSGYMREGLASLFEADVIIFTNCQKMELSKNEQKCWQRLRLILHPYSHFSRPNNFKIILPARWWSKKINRGFWGYEAGKCCLWYCWS